MKLKHLLTKTLLVAVGLFVGTSAWGASRIDMTTMTGLLGLTDNSTPAWTYYSKTVTLKAGETYTYTFQNYTKGSSATAESETWIAEIRENTTNYCLDARGDGGGWKWEPSSENLSYNYSGKAWNEGGRTLSDFMTAYNNVTVTLTISCSNDGKTVTIARTATLNGDTDFSGTWTCSGFAGNEKTINLIAEASHLYITKVDCNGSQFNYVSSESAYTDQANSTTNYNGASVDNLKLYYTQFRDWGSSDGTVKVNAAGKIAFYKFDLTDIKNKLATDGGTITGVTFSVYGKGNGGDCGKVRVLGYNSTWDATTITNDNVSNSAGTITGLVTSTGSFQPLNTTAESTLNSAGLTLSENALTYVNSAIAENKDYVSFAITANYTREGLMNTFANLEFSYSAAVLYEATFSETNSLDPTVTVYTDAGRTAEIAKNELEANTTYYYRAVLAGYETYEGSFNVETSNPTVNFTMTALPRYTFTVNAVNSVGGAVIQALYTDDDSYDGKVHNVSFPAYLTGVGNAVTYSKDNGTYYQSYTSSSADATKTQSYTAYSGEAYFFEGEDITGAVSYTGESFGVRSSNGAAGVLSAATIASLDAGIYKITVRSIGKASQTHSIYKESTSGEKILDIVTNTTGTIESAIFSLDATTDIVANGGYSTTSDNGHGFDYILIEKDPTVSAKIGSTGYTTFASSYALNIDGMTASTGTVKAYYVTASDVKSSSVALTEVTGNVAAGTGLILEGTASATITIPVVASGTDYTSTNMLVGCTADFNITASTLNYGNFYVLSATAAEFKKIKNWVDAPNTLTIPAGKAYLDTTGAGVVGAPSLTFDLNGEATGIADVSGKMSVVSGDFFDLQGRKVAQPTKGLYIVNGKKVVIK